jgi:putative lipoic acid-binding regulatory protein
MEEIHVMVEMLMVKARDDLFSEDLLEHVQVHHHPTLRHLTTHAHLEGVVMSVTVEVIAEPIELYILLIRELRVVEAMRS